MEELSKPTDVAVIRLAHWVSKEVGGTPEQNLVFSKEVVALLQPILCDDDTANSLQETPALTYRLAEAYGQAAGFPEWSREPLIGDLDNPLQFAATQARWESENDERQAGLETMAEAIAQVLAEYTPPGAEEVDVTGWMMGPDDSIDCCLCGEDVDTGLALTITRPSNPFLDDDHDDQNWETFWRHKVCPPPEE